MRALAGAITAVLWPFGDGSPSLGGLTMVSLVGCAGTAQCHDDKPSDEQVVECALHDLLAPKGATGMARARQD